MNARVVVRADVWNHRRPDGGQTNRESKRIRDYSFIIGSLTDRQIMMIMAGVVVTVRLGEAQATVWLEEIFVYLFMS